MLSSILSSNEAVFLVACLACAVTGFIVGRGQLLTNHSERVNDLLSDVIIRYDRGGAMKAEVEQTAREEDLLWHPSIKDIVEGDDEDDTPGEN